MKCYIGGSYTPFEYEWVSVCFAKNRNEAKKIMWNSRLADECDNEWVDARVVRKKEYDKLYDGREGAYVVTDEKILREMGWMMEGDSICDSCGLAEYQGRYPVCEECYQCIECGHNDDCESIEE